MRPNIGHIVYALIFTALISVSIISCSTDAFDIYSTPESEQTTGLPDRTINPSDRQVFIYMGLGFNNLTRYLADDIEELAANRLPTNLWHDDVVLVFSHLAPRTLMYSELTSPTLTRLYRDDEGEVVRDTLLIMDKTTIAASDQVVGEVLKFIKDRFPAASYGMLISSHGTGWTPAEYTYDPSKFDDVDDEAMPMLRAKKKAKPFLESLAIDGEPAVKSIGVHNRTGSEAIDMDITGLAACIPMKMDYIIFDACFMGGVEVAYEFRNKCDYMVFSQTEILADGMDYKTMTSYLLEGNKPDLRGFCENYFNFYDRKYSQERSATVSLVNCNELEGLAEVCNDIFTKYRTSISLLEYKSGIQQYYRSLYKEYHKWFYDLEDIIKNCGTTAQELSLVNEALSKCVVYKMATPKFMNSITITNHSGLSMYVPYFGRTYLNTFYKTLEWNKATSLVQ